MSDRRMTTHRTTTATTAAAGPTDAVVDETAAGEEGSLVSEYGLVAVLGATIAGLAISWARGGAIVSLLDMVLRQVQSVIA